MGCTNLILIEGEITSPLFKSISDNKKVSFYVTTVMTKKNYVTNSRANQVERHLIECADKLVEIANKKIRKGLHVVLKGALRYRTGGSYIECSSFSVYVNAPDSLEQPITEELIPVEIDDAGNR